MDSASLLRETNIKKPLEDVYNGVPVAAVSRNYEIPRTTLRERLHGSQPIRIAKEDPQRLSARQEEQLIKWILSEEEAGRPPNKRELASFAELIASLEEKFRDFWNRLDYQIKTKSVGSSRIYNMDEIGVVEGETRAGQCRRVGIDFGPLDVGVFSPLKEFYRQQLAGLVDFTITAPRQKQRFIRAYKTASEHAFTKENIQAGFRASGIYPTNVNRPLAAAIKPWELREPPKTPEHLKIPKKKEWWTPRDSKEVKGQTDFLRRNLDGVDHGLRTIAVKAGHAIDERNSLISSLKTENDYLKAKIEAVKPAGRKAVKTNPNETFASIPAIVKARTKAREAPRRYEERHSANVQEEAQAVREHEEEGGTIHVYED
ncbi:hypothetical protein RJ55_07254 [Drechmeria coniospora]|nr:hypothetical protein RJ55_07254 [Drechmeria coniospora]